MFRIFTLAFVLMVAAAQAPQMPKTTPLTNNDGKIIGTATVSGNRAYLRDNNGELFATIIMNRDGSKTFFDPNGKQIEAKDVQISAEALQPREPDMPQAPEQTGKAK